MKQESRHTECFHSPLRGTVILLMTVLSVVCLSSCDGMIYDYEGDCDPHWRVRFEYDYNMKFADAFPGPMGVGSVQLYVFDAVSGRLVLDKADVSGAEGFSKDYVMPIEELAPGRYRFVAWCGLESNNSFTGGVAPHVYEPEATAWSLSEQALGGNDREERRLGSLYYGDAGEVEITAEEGTHTITVPLMKDVNDFTVILQHRSQPLDPEDFEITITDDNSTLLWNNSIAAETDPVEYKAWEVRQGTAEETIKELGIPTVENNVLVSFLTTSRLVGGRQVEPRLTVTRKSTGRVVFDFPLLPYLLMGYHQAPLDAHNNPYRMEDQEYLDREDTWGMHFILDDELSGRGGWHAFELHLLDWHVVLSDEVLGEYN